MDETRADTSGVPGISIRWLFESPTVRIQRWTCEVSARHVTPERCQPWHVVGFVHSGAYELRDRRGASLHDSTRVSFFNAGASYQTSHPVGLGDRGSSLIVAGDVLREVIAIYEPAVENQSDVPFRFAQAPISGPTLLRHHVLLRKSEEIIAADPIEMEEASLELTHRVIREAYGFQSASKAHSSRASDRRQAVEAARAFLTEGFTSVRRLGDVARAAGVSAFHLCRIFKSEMGCTVHAYLNKLRLRAALDRLPGRAGDLSSLALEIGFSSHSHFTDAFRQEFGALPSAVAEGRRAIS